YKVAGEVVELMRQWYPELAGKREQAAMIIKAEEDRFLKTLDSGLERWAGVLRQYRETGVIPGEELFKLHDTFGFHIELVKELAAESGVGLDITGFEQAMQEQRERSKKETFVGPVPVAGELESTFVGYDQDEVETELVRFTPLPDNRFEVVLKDSPFYAEMGGQVGDTGRIVGEDFELEVLDTHQQHGVRSCKARLVRGELRTGPVRAAVDVERRREIERAHTATHLLHAALRRTLGDYVKQEGSLVEPGRLRFDFAAFEPLGPEQIQAVERLVYEQVIADRKVEALRDLPLEQAKGLGALAFFGEQYGERVTVIKVGDFSMELCGGTHLRRTGQIGHFRIVSETGVAAGVRRIVALVGRAAQEQARHDRMTLDLLQQKLGTGEDTLVKKVDSLQQELKRLDNRVRALAGQLARAMGDELARSAADIGSVKVVVGHLSGFEAADLRLVADRVRELLTTQCVGLITGGDAARARYVVFSSPDVQQELPAGRLAKIVGSAMAGGGGGRPDIAEGGGEVERLSAAQHAFRTAIQETVEGRREG
ncbi:MAG: alanine--tRNA ligase-related protein, partial [candidate division WOR-3 bacterium]